ncbi:hypothetical protein [Albidovulum sediminis]|uniref:Glycerol-3-phosphate dehydrogenase n=1 Tax=Albidovulum sediminis TaxID=3066345 RepID=A0ABT2NQK1_9RHOB|nr:hypothetical protein [Defluviimonas sediminis]MCT8330373.1 hypothetical protein [Defluviimonas sediminis]
MSDHRTNLDVEDVLSSIRRLVSQDARAACPVAPASMEKLVLTPALRVNDAGLVGPGEAASEERDRLEETIVELEAAVANLQAEFEADDGDAPAAVAQAVDFGPEFDLEPVDEDGTPAEEALEASATDGQAEDLAAAEDRDWPEAPDTDAAEDEASAVEARSDVIDADDGTTDEADAHEAVDASEAPAFAGSDEIEDAIILDDIEDAEEVAEVEPAAVEGAPDGDRDDAPELAEHRDRLHLGAGPEVESAADEAQFDEGEFDDYEEAEPVDGDARSPGFAQRASVMEPGEIDNDLLRTMVATLVREELQGALGERMTDRLRKLVRREVQIALGQRERD